MKTAKYPNDIPEGHHYAILLFKSESVYIPGDERSRTNPGHGYPGGTKTYSTNEYQFTHDRDEWVKRIESLELEIKHSTYKKPCYAALEVAAKATVKTHVVVGVETKQ